MERHFGRDRLHIVDSGDFFTEPEAVYDGVLDIPGAAQPGLPGVQAPQRPAALAHARPVRKALEEHYRPYDERLAAWLGHEPSWRRGG